VNIIDYNYIEMITLLIYLLFAGIITESFGYSATIHSINILTAIALIMWLVESALRRALGKPYNPPEE